MLILLFITAAILILCLALKLLPFIIAAAVIWFLIL